MPVTQLESTTYNQVVPALYPDDALTVPMPVKPSSTYAAGTAMGRVTADDHLDAYDNGNADGTEDCVGILKYQISTDANGKIYLGDSAAPSTINKPVGQTTALFITGIFDPADLTGYDAAAGVDLGVKVIPGDTGLIRIP